MNTQRFLVVTDSYPAGWEYGTFERACQVAIDIAARVVVEERQKGDKGLWSWVRVEGPRKPQEAPPADLATDVPDEAVPPSQPQKTGAGVKSAKRGRSRSGPKRRRVAK